MCLPLVPALMIGGAVVGAAGSVMGGIASRNASNYQGQIADRNAGINLHAAQDALERGRTEEYRSSMKVGRVIGEQRAAMGANGIEVDYGSGANVQQDARTIGQQDQATMRANSARESAGYEISAWNSRASASADRANAKAAMTRGIFDAGSTLLGAANQLGKAGYLSKGPPSAFQTAFGNWPKPS